MCSGGNAESVTLKSFYGMPERSKDLANHLVIQDVLFRDEDHDSQIFQIKLYGLALLSCLLL